VKCIGSLGTMINHEGADEYIGLLNLSRSCRKPIDAKDIVASCEYATS